MRSRTLLVVNLLVWSWSGFGMLVSARPNRAAASSGTVGGGLPISALSDAGGEVVGSKANTDVAPSFGEPSCEQLRAMWRFSKRQSRAAEITNEIPTYRDPFTNNIWQTPYDSDARSRSIAGTRVGYRPVYGRIVHKAPMSRHVMQPERNRAFEEVFRLYGTVHRGHDDVSPRRQTQFRLPGGHVGHAVTAHSGSFQHLKELIRNERVRELQQQRLAEEMAARAAVLKASGKIPDRKYGQTSQYTYDDSGEDILNDEGSMKDYMIASLNAGNGLLTFPDPVAQPSSMLRPAILNRYEPRFFQKLNMNERDDRNDLLQAAFNNDADDL